MLRGPNSFLLSIAFESNLTAPIAYAREGQKDGRELLLCGTQRKRVSQTQEMKKELFLSSSSVLLGHKLLGSTTKLCALLYLLCKVTLMTARAESRL